MLSKRKYCERIYSSISLNSEAITILSLVIFFFLEILNKVYFFIQKEATFSLSFYPKIFIQFLFIFPVLFSYSKLKIFSKLLVWFSGVLIFSVFLKFSSSTDELIWGLKHFNKLLLFFYVYIFFEVLRPKLYFALRMLDWIYITASVIILFGFFFQIEYLKSYPFTERFGYSGVFTRMAVNDVSFFYLIGVFYLFYRWRQNEIPVVFFLIVFFSSFLVGTKAIYLQNVLLIIYVIIKDKQRQVMILSAGGVALLFLLVVYNFSFWTQLLNERGLLAVLTSLRSELFVKHLPALIENFSISSFFIGYSSPFQYYTEMDLFDLFVTFGIIGGGLLIVLYAKILFDFKRAHHFAWFFVGVFILMATISGRYTYSGLNALYFPLSLYYLRVSWDENHHC